MQKKKHTRIFALMRNGKVIVSRCSAVKLSAVVYSHCRGKHKQTQGHFDLEQNRPDLYVLEEVEAESYMTYRHLLAWIHVFEVAGYTVLNDEEVLENSRDLHPETRQIFDRIQEMPLALHLEYSYCSSYRAGDHDQKRMTPNPPASTSSDYYAATEKLSIRLSKAEKEILSGFAKSLNLSLRDALLYAVHRVMLCDDTTLAADQQVYSFQERHMQEIQKLICNDLCQEAILRNRGHHRIKLSERHHERVLVSVLGIGHSDIRGLDTAGQWSAGSATV